MLFSANDEELKKKFAVLQNKRDIADLLEIKLKDLIYYLYRFDEDQKYYSFSINKKKSQKRLIMAPNKSLLFLQKRLNYILQLTYSPHPNSHGFIPNKSIITNAEPHVNKKYVLNIDLKDFFPSINFRRVRGMFKSKPFNFNYEVANVLAQICCFEDQLPQGAPTSPFISNIICRRLDNDILRLAKKFKCNYTRYADDITISTNLSSFPKCFAKEVYSHGTYELKLGFELKNIIYDNTFIINDEKVRLSKKFERQEVTGLIVNEKVNIKRKFVREIRAMLHSWEKYGLEAAEDYMQSKYYKKQKLSLIPPPSFMNVLKGKINYLKMIKGINNPIFRKYSNKYYALADSPHNMLPEYDLDLELLFNLRDKFDEIKEIESPQERGFAFEGFLNELFSVYLLSPNPSFRIDGEQIDGSFELDGETYLVEAKWKKAPISLNEISAFHSKVETRAWARGLFISFSGFHKDAFNNYTRGRTPNLITMSGDDIYSILYGYLGKYIHLKDALREKVRSLNERFDFKISFDEIISKS